MRLLIRALDLLFPPKCPFCRAVLDDPRAPLCPTCQTTLPWLAPREAVRKIERTEGCWSPLAYREQVRQCIRRYKFNPVRAYGKPLGLLMAQCVRDHGEIAPDLVTWTPLSRKSLRKRGFDQAGLLADTVGAELSLPVCATLLKIRHTQRQSHLETPAQRRANVLGAYISRPGADIRGRRILLVDDVVTSGATLSACAGELMAAGAEQVWCLTLAQAGK